jgi:hypothetical protein
MNSNYYLGIDPLTRLGDTPRFFYGLRKNENGSLFLQRNDQLKDKDAIEINRVGDEANNFTDFEVGVDFFEGIDVNHNTVFKNLKYQQYRWDIRSMFYYIDEEGQLVAKLNTGHTYDLGASEE